MNGTKIRKASLWLAAGILAVAALAVGLISLDRGTEGARSPRDSPPVKDSDFEKVPSNGWPPSIFDPETQTTYLKRSDTGEIIVDPAGEAFSWAHPADPLLIIRVLTEIERAANSKAAARRSTNILEQLSGGPVKDRPTAVLLSSAVQGLPMDLIPRRGFETSTYFVFSNRGRYDFGDFSYGIAIRKADGKVFHWSDPKRRP